MKHRLNPGRSQIYPITARLIAILGLLGLLVACAPLPPAPASLVTPTAGPVVVAAAPSPESPAITGKITLSWWTPELISPQAPPPGGPLLETSLAEFSATREDDIAVEPILKARYGKGGLLDFLRTAQLVAPSILPDIVSLDVSEFEQAAELGILQPLQDLLPAETLQSLYPFARQAGQVGDQILAVQYMADIDHLAYLRSRVEIVPTNWAELLQRGSPYLFPTASLQPLSSGSPTESMQPVFVSQYLSAGGSQDPGTRQLLLQDEPLLRVLTFYDEARTAGVLPSESSETHDLSAVWAAYVSGQAPLAQVSARRYLAERETLPNVGYAPAPGWSGPLTPITSGWVLAIVTKDPARQQAAAELFAWLLAADHAGPWTQATGWLPTSPQAFSAWDADPYYAFLDEQLARAISPPAGPNYLQIAGRMQRAVTTVLNGEATPAEATLAANSP